jgi:hypothetical protein
MIFATTALASLLGGASVAAPSKTNKQVQENTARKACLDGDYRQGVAALTTLFVQTRDPTYIFNQGRCLEQNRRYEDAIARFQEYLRAGRKSLEANDKVEAEQHIADCKEMLAQERGTAPPPAAPQPLTALPAAPKPEPAPAPETVPVVAETAPKDSPTSNGAGLRIGGIVVASVGVAAVVAGVLFNLKANSAVDSMYTVKDGYTKDSERKTYTTLAWVGYGVGAASVVTGAILYGVGLKAKPTSEIRVALIPTFGTNEAGAALTGAF